MPDIRAEYYQKHFWNVHYKGILGVYSTSGHKKVEKNRKSSDTFSKVLEIGGGGGEHLPFVKHKFDSYTMLDIREDLETFTSLKERYKEKQLVFLLADAKAIPSDISTFDRIVSTCVLHHISDLELALTEVRRVAKNGAFIDLYVPCDPGMLYRYIRHWTSHLKQKIVMKLTWREVKFLWAIEHRNHYLGIISIIHEIFKNDKITISRYPFKINSWNFNLYSIVTIEVCKK